MQVAGCERHRVACRLSEPMALATGRQTQLLEKAGMDKRFLTPFLETTRSGPPYDSVTRLPQLASLTALWRFHRRRAPLPGGYP